MSGKKLAMKVSAAVAEDRLVLDSLCQSESARLGVTPAGPPVVRPLIPATFNGEQVYPDEPTGLVLVEWAVT